VVEDDIPNLIADLDTDDAEREQNTAYVLAKLVEEYPGSVGEYHADIVAHLSTESVPTQRNLLSALILSISQTSPVESVGRDAALDLLSAEDEVVAIYAALLLSMQSTTTSQSELIASRIGSLLPTVAQGPPQLNCISVLAQLDASDPESARNLVPDAAALLKDS
jgi:hypothetical protein